MFTKANAVASYLVTQPTLTTQISQLSHAASLASNIITIRGGGFVDTADTVINKVILPLLNLYIISVAFQKLAEFKKFEQEKLEDLREDIKELKDNLGAFEDKIEEEVKVIWERHRKLMALIRQKGAQVSKEWDQMMKEGMERQSRAMAKVFGKK